MDGQLSTEAEKNRINEERLRIGARVRQGPNRTESFQKLVKNVISGNLNEVELLLQQLELDVNGYDTLGNTPLIWACMMG